MIEVKAVDDIIFEQHLRGTASQITHELITVNVSVLQELNKQAGKGFPTSATIIAFVRSMIRSARENAEMIDGLDNRRVMKENKSAFVQELGELLAEHSRTGVQWLSYSRDADGFEAVTIHYATGGERTVSVTGDSCLAIMHDVYKALI